jgi:hypothetical protein
MEAPAAAFFPNISLLQADQCRIGLCHDRMAHKVSTATAAALWLLVGALGTNDDQQAVKLLDEARK